MFQAVQGPTYTHFCVWHDIKLGMGHTIESQHDVPKLAGEEVASKQGSTQSAASCSAKYEITPGS